MDRTVTTIIDQDLCVGCGMCIPVCPSDTITMENGKACVTGDESLNCEHCAAVCPTGAIRVGSIDPSMYRFKTFPVNYKWNAHGEFDTESLVNLMQSRRSCRNYTNTPIDTDILEDLIKTGITAPSGTNSQRWTFTVLPDRQSVEDLGDKVRSFFLKLNKTAEKAWLRKLLSILGKPELATYYTDYYQSVKDRLKEWEETGRDSLFHGATAAIVVGSKKDASCPAEDALLATQNMLLAAHSMGLGTCLIGFVIAAMRQDKSIKKFLDIPGDETAYSVIALGYPDEKFQRVTGRKPAEIRYFRN